MSGGINLLCVLLEDQTWTQNHVLPILTYVHYSITVKRDHSPIYIYISSLAKSGSKGLRYKAFKSDIPAKILPYEFIYGQVSPATLKL